MKIDNVLKNAQNQISLVDAQSLLCHLLSQSRSYLIAHNDESLPEDLYQRFQSYVDRCAHGEPVAYIIGYREFWSLDFEVNQHTLIPRPETELIVEWVLNHFTKDKPLKMADLGTGSGVIALSIANERREWEVIATDISENALAIARKNAHRLELGNVAFFEGNWCTALPFNDFDVIVSNPPYIAETEWHEYAEGLAFEPRTALVSGEDGADAIKTICKNAKNHLKPKGYLIVEHGFLQGKAVREIFETAGFNSVVTVQDFSGHERITLGQC